MPIPDPATDKPAKKVSEHSSGHRTRFGKRVFGFLGLTILMAAVVGGLLMLSREKVLGRVGTYKATEAEVLRVAKENPSLTKDEIVTKLLDLNLYRQAAAAVDVHITNQEVESEVSQRIGDAQIGYREYLKNLVEIDLLKQRLETRVPGGTKGKIIIIHFDQHFYVFGAADFGPGEVEAQRPEYIADDRAAADSLKETIYQKLKSKEINFDQAMELQKNDPKLGEKAMPTAFHSQAFNTADTQNSLTSLLAQQDLKELIDTTPFGEHSEPRLIKILVSDLTNESKEGIWAIVQVDARQERLAHSFDEFINAKKQELKYEKLL